MVKKQVYKNSSSLNLTLKLIRSYFFVFLITIFCTSFSFLKKEKKILVFSKTQAFRHKSIKEGKKMFLELGKTYGLKIDTTEVANVFNSNLHTYKAIVFLNTSGNILDSVQKLYFQKFIQNGGGFVGIHAASDTEMQWNWYNSLVGAYFNNHPKPQNAVYTFTQKDFFDINHLPDSLTRFEEIYNFKSVKINQTNTLISVNENSYQGGNMGNFHPVCWYRKFDGGKSFYIALGHHPETYSDTLFQQLVWKGLNKVL